jgi:hydrogenase maturation protease
MAPRVLVLGVGNPDRGDDAAGLEVARRLRDTVPGDVQVREMGLDGMAMLDAWEGPSTVVIVDAMSSGAMPGTVERFDATDDPMPSRRFGTSTHAFSVAEAVELGRALGRLPEKVVVIGIEGKCFDPGARLSPEVERGLDQVVDRVLREL